jgi:hypothetical protein
MAQAPAAPLALAGHDIEDKWLKRAHGPSKMIAPFGSLPSVIVTRGVSLLIPGAFTTKSPTLFWSLGMQAGRKRESPEERLWQRGNRASRFHEKNRLLIGFHEKPSKVLEKVTL